MKRWGFVLVQLFFAAPAFGSQELTADDLRRAGIVRVADVLGLAEGWSFDTIEGFTLNGRPPGFPFGERPAYLVMIDDVPIDLDQLGVTSLNRLPLSLDDIAGVSIESGPAFARGRFTPGGIIHFRTRRPSEPVEVRARHAVGSETGDPGPYQFTEFNSQNVERFGFESSVSAGGKLGSLWTDGAYRRARHYASDEAILDRYVEIGGPDFRVLEKEAPSFRIGFSPLVPLRRATGFARASKIDEGFFLRPLGQETPVVNRFHQVGAEMVVSAHDRFVNTTGNDNREVGQKVFGGSKYSSRWHPSALLMATANELDAWDETNPELDWRTRSIEGDLTATRHWTSIGVRAGIHDVRAKASSREDSWTSGGIFGRWSRRYSNPNHTKFRTDADFAVERSRGEIGIAMSASHRRGTMGKAFAEVRLAAARILPEESAPFWYWGERELSFFKEQSSVIPANVAIEATKLVSLDATTTMHTRHFASLKVDAFLRSLGDVAVERSDSLLITTDGNLAGGTFSFIAPVRRMRFRGWIRFQDSVGGTSAFRDAARAAPRLLGRASMVTTPFPNFDVDVALRAQSSTTVAAWSSLDLSIQKYFMRRRLRAGLSFQNLLNNPYRTHPIGQITGLTVAVQLELLTSGM